MRSASIIVMGLIFASGCQQSGMPIDTRPDPGLGNAPILKKKHGLRTSGPLTREQQAIVLALEPDHEILTEGLTALGTDAQPSQLLAVIDQLLTKLQAADLSECPPQFQQDFANYKSAWVEARALLARLPDAYSNGLFVKHFLGLFGADQRAVDTLGADLSRAIQEVAKSQAKLYQTARGQGLVELE